jgi:hypothetical protein
MDFGYQDECGVRTVTLETTRRTLPSDERITVKLFNPEEEVKQDFGKNFDEYRPVTDKKNTQATVKKEYPSVSITGSDHSHKDSIQNTTKKSDMTFRNSDGNFSKIPLTSAFPDRSGSKKGQDFAASDSKSIADLKSPFGQMNIQPHEGNVYAVVNSNTHKKAKASLRKSLMQDFEDASHKDSKFEELKLPSEDKNCNKELEDLISTFNNFKPKAKLVDDKQRFSAVFSLPKTETTKCTSTLSNQVHNILFSHPFDLSQESHEEQKSHDEFFSFDNHETEDKLYEVVDNLQYDLTDYSDNSSSNVGSYNFHEEEVELPGHAKMFQYFNNVQLNLKDSQTLGFEHDSFSLNKFESQEMGMMMQNSQPSQTIFHDYMYYLRQNQNGATQGVNEDNEREKRLSKLNGSPTKMHVRTKKLYCNDKEVPSWAWDLDEIEKVSKDQKKVFNTDHIFGNFNVDNLNLVEVFQRNDYKFIRPR